MKTILKISMVVMAMMASGRVYADHYERIECTARDLQSASRGLVAEFRYNFRYHPEYRCLMAEAAEAHAHSARALELAARRADPSDLRREVRSLDRIVDNIQDLLVCSPGPREHGFSSYLPTPSACNDGRARRIVRDMDSSVRVLSDLIAELCHIQDTRRNFDPRRRPGFGRPDFGSPDFRILPHEGYEGREGRERGTPSGEFGYREFELSRPRVWFSPSTSRSGTMVYRQIRISDSK